MAAYGLWLSYSSNTEFLEGTEIALLQRIQGDAELRAIFLTKGTDRSAALYQKAIAIYKVYVQDFLKQALVLCYI